MMIVDYFYLTILKSSHYTMPEIPSRRLPGNNAVLAIAHLSVLDGQFNIRVSNGSTPKEE
jgi:hypothetical protein